MNILLYNPDNEITNNFMPHLWMFLLKSLTPPGHKVFLIDGNARRMSSAGSGANTSGRITSAWWGLAP